MPNPCVYPLRVYVPSCASPLRMYAVHVPTACMSPLRVCSPVSPPVYVPHMCMSVRVHFCSLGFGLGGRFETIEESEFDWGKCACYWLPKAIAKISEKGTNVRSVFMAPQCVVSSVLLFPRGVCPSVSSYIPPWEYPSVRISLREYVPPWECPSVRMSLREIVPPWVCPSVRMPLGEIVLPWDCPSVSMSLRVCVHMRLPLCVYLRVCILRACVLQSPPTLDTLSVDCGGMEAKPRSRQVGQRRGDSGRAVSWGIDPRLAPKVLFVSWLKRMCI